MHLILMGAPGSGKGSYAAVLKEHYRVPHISTGEIFRDAIEKKTPMGLIAKTYIDKGNLVPDDITNEIVKERLKQKDCENGFLLDGYPRTIAQAESLTKILDELGITLDAAVNLEVDDDLIVRRIVNRRSCPKCGKGYNLITYPPKKEGICDVCNTPLFTRKDDNEETVTSRLDVYNKQTRPLVDYYDKLGKLVSIDSNGTIEDTVKDIIKTLEA
ncbi:MAG: adenylate kinase [Mollicutes bacterium]|nr:adenylate kinase [Mollicutes bacterium]